MRWRSGRRLTHPKRVSRKTTRVPGRLSSTGRVVESITPLYVGQIVQARRKNRGSFWFAARIKQLLPDGKVELGFLTLGRRTRSQHRDRHAKQYSACLLNYEQPVPRPTEIADGPWLPAAARTWADATGRFKIDAVFVSVTDGKVTLRRTDGKTMQIPVDKLSSQDQTHVKKLQAEMKTRKTTRSSWWNDFAICRRGQYCCRWERRPDRANHLKPGRSGPTFPLILLFSPRHGGSLPSGTVFLVADNREDYVFKDSARILPRALE